MPTPTVADLYARQLFSFPVPVVQKLVLHATEPESVLKDLDSLFGGSAMSFDTPLISLVLLLVRHRLPASPTPALDYAWETKGARASREDMDIFWDRERRNGGVTGSAGGAGGLTVGEGTADGLGPSPLPKRIHADLPPTSTTDLPHVPDKEPSTPDSPASTSSNFSVAPVDVRRIQSLDDADMSIRASSRPTPTAPPLSQPQRKSSLTVGYPPEYTNGGGGGKRGSISGRKVSGSGSIGGGADQEDAFKVAMKKRMDESKEAAERRVFVQL